MNSMRRLLILAGLWLLCAMAHAGTAHYYYTDPQGTVLARADGQGNILASYDYKPYGVQALGASPNGPGYTGHVNDPDTGLVYMQQRYYDPAVGRFLSVDPAGPAAGNAFNFSRYAYGNDNPARFTDPDGRQSVGEMIDAGAQGCGAVSCVGWALLHAGWTMTGAEPLSQVADKGWSNVSTGDKIGAAVAVAAVVPVGRIVGKIAEGAVAVRYGPLNPGPLAYDIAATFRSASYTGRTLDQPTALYRMIGAKGNPIGSFWTATEPRGPLQSVIDFALDQNWLSLDPCG